MSEPDTNAQKTTGPDLEERHPVRGRQRGDRYVRIVRPSHREFERRDAGHLVATERILAPTSAPGRIVDRVRRLLLGARIPTSAELSEREDALTLDKPHTPLPRRASPRVLVLLARLDRASLEALAYARSIAPLVTAVHVTDDPAEGDRIRDRWRTLDIDGDTDLVILESPYRALIPPLVAYIDALQKQEPLRPIAVVVSEFVRRHPWEYLLHNQAALRLKLRLFFRPNTVVIDVPYHI